MDGCRKFWGSVKQWTVMDTERKFVLVLQPKRKKHLQF